MAGDVTLAARKVKIALLGSYTVNNVVPFLQKALEKSSFDVEIKVGGYNQYLQELLDEKSWLVEYKPDVIVALLSTRTVFPNLEYALVGEGQKQIEELVKLKFSLFQKALQAYALPALLMVTTLEYPRHSPLGIQKNGTCGIRQAIDWWNKSLREIVEKRSSMFIVDFEKVCSEVGKARLTDEKMYYLGRILLSQQAADVLAQELATYVRAIYGERKKCVVVDLDNTLWKGVVGEDGVGGIIVDDSNIGSIYQDIQKVLLMHKQKGILLAVASKNNPEDVKEVFSKKEGMVLKEEDFIVMKINWEPKSKSIALIAKELNIGVDSMVFLDDNPAERFEVKARLPDVEVIDFPEDVALLPSMLKGLPYFETLALTEEDKKRHELYQQEKSREELKKNVPMEDYLADLGTKIRVRKNDEPSLERITQLINKTNQFNLRTRRYSAEEVSLFMRAPSSFVASLHAADKFGELGLTGVAIVTRKEDMQTYFIDTFLMSCRIMGRGIELQFFIEVLKMLPKGAKTLEAEYLPTKKNEAVKDFFDQLGFSAIPSKEGKSYRMALGGIPKDVPYIEVQ